MKESTKSLIRHILTSLGTIVALLGVDQFVPILQFLIESLDDIWGAVVAIIGFVTTLFGYFKDKNRHEDRAQATGGEA